MPSPADGTRGRASAAAVGLGLAVFVVASLGAPMRPAAAADCQPSVMLDGVLGCPPRAPVRDACGQAHALVAGDALDTQACAGAIRMPGVQLAALGIPVSVNTAAADELASLPGVGPVLAQRVIDGRPYASFEDLLAVSGIGPVTLAAIRSRVVFRTR